MRREPMMKHALERTIVGSVVLGIFQVLASKHPELVDILQAEGWSHAHPRYFDTEEVRAIHIHQPKCRPRIRSLCHYFQIGYLEVSHVTHKKTRGWKIAEHGRLWIPLFEFWRLALRKFAIAATRLMEEHVAYLQIFNHVPRHSADICAQGCSSGTRDIAHDDALERPYLGSFPGSTQASSKPQE